MPKQAERLFLALAVDEISLVDEPANEKEIIVAKRKEQEMTTAAIATAAEQTADSPNSAAQEADVNKDTGTEVVETELDDGTPDEVVDALKALVSNVLTVATSKKGGMEEKGGGQKKASDKLPPFLKAMEEKLKAQGLAKADIDKALSAAKAAFGPSGLAAEEPTKKAAEPAPAAEPPATLDEDELVMKTLEAISKAKSFTPGRIKKLVQAITNLDSLLTELGIDKASFGASGIMATPTAATPSPGVMDAAGTGGAGKPGNAIRKDKDGEPTGLTAEGIAAAVAKALEPVTEKLTEVGARVDAIEKARTPSTQPGDGEQDGEPVKKSKSIWSGVL